MDIASKSVIMVYRLLQPKGLCAGSHNVYDIVMMESCYVELSPEIHWDASQSVFKHFFFFLTWIERRVQEADLERLEREVRGRTGRTFFYNQEKALGEVGLPKSIKYCREVK